MLSVFLVARIFCKTFYYYLLTILKPHSLKDLKQHWAINLMCDFGYSISVSGEPPAPGPMILVGNHISYLDIMLVMSVHPDVDFIAKKEVSNWPVIGVAAARAGTVFVDRSNSGDGRTKRRMIADALKKNSSQVVVFPSGTTALSESKAWKKGIFEIARRQPVDCPPCLGGSRDRLLTGILQRA